MSRENSPSRSQVRFFCTSVLAVAGTELIFFLVASTVLCFAFSVRIMLIIH